MEEYARSQECARPQKVEYTNKVVKDDVEQSLSSRGHYRVKRISPKVSELCFSVYRRVFSDG
jgi:hypothetical protein